MSHVAVEPTVRGVMEPAKAGYRYDKIATWWNYERRGSTTGLGYVRRAAGLASGKRRALDVGCGSGGRLLDVLERLGFDVTGVDVSGDMVGIARKNHPGARIVLADTCRCQPPREYDVVVAWDSTFRVPYSMQREVIAKPCGALADGGVVLFTAGAIDGEISGRMGGQEFY